MTACARWSLTVYVQGEGIIISGEMWQGTHGGPNPLHPPSSSTPSGTYACISAGALAPFSPHLLPPLLA
jgi:hypothetical protein